MRERVRGNEGNGEKLKNEAGEGFMALRLAGESWLHGGLTDLQMFARPVKDSVDRLGAFWSFHKTSRAKM